MNTPTAHALRWQDFAPIISIFVGIAALLAIAAPSL
jgi:hypothetical protein